MTNPNDAIGTNAAYGSRTSVNAFNDIAQLVSGRGITSGWAVVPDSGMTVNVGGVAGTRDVAIAEDNLGNRTTINNKTGLPVSITLEAASSSSDRYDAIVAYVNNPAQAEDETPDAPSVCGIIAVQGSSTGVSEAQIRAAISADGGTGSVAYYVVLATISVPQNTSTITSSYISQSHTSILGDNIGDGVIAGRMIADNTIPASKFQDTGWVEATYKSGYAAPASGEGLGPLKFRIRGGVVYVQGGVAKSGGGAMPSGEAIIATIPSEITTAVQAISGVPMGTALGRMKGFTVSQWSFRWDNGDIYCYKEAVTWAAISASFAI